MGKDSWKSVYHDILDTLEDNDDILSDWEKGFVKSIRDWLYGDKILTPKQIDCLDKIMDKVNKRRV